MVVKPTFSAVNQASLEYAKALNSKGLTPVVQNILKGNVEYEGFIAAPYMFFDRNGFDYEDDDNNYELVASLYLGTNEGDMFDIDEIDESKQVLQTVIADSFLWVLQQYKLGTIYKKFAGILGVKVHNSDGSDFGEHYVAYVYNNGKMSFFDSGAPGGCSSQNKTNNTFIILETGLRKIAKADGKRFSSICNKSTFETAAGASDDEYNYIGQNIFCHSWSLWFLYQRIVLGKSMNEIDKLAGEGLNDDRDNLIRIKSFVYTYLIPKAGLTHLYCKPKFIAFIYYIVNPSKARGSRKKSTRMVEIIPGLTPQFIDDST